MKNKANPRYLKALSFAAARHGAVRQARKGTHFPYVVHPIRVAEILERFDYGEDVVIAGLLHDTVEDAGVNARRAHGDVRRARRETRREGLGARQVARLACAQAAHDRAHRDEDDHDALALVAADKLDNVRSLRETLRAQGEKKTWAIFNAGRSGAALVLPDARRRAP